jgi:tetratricopeptide (TPR) repeat protein
MKILTQKRWLPALFLAIVGLFASTLLWNSFTKEASAFSISNSERQQKIDKGFEQLRFANNSIEAETIEAQLVMDLSQAKLASSNLIFASAQKRAEEKDFTSALNLLQTIQKNEPDFVEAYVNGAYMAFELGDKKMALAMLQRAVKLEPRHFAAWFGIGTLLDEASDVKGAKAAYENALYHNPNFDAAKRALFAIEAKTKGIGL